MHFIENYYAIDGKNIYNNNLEIVSVLLKITTQHLLTMHYNLILCFPLYTWNIYVYGWEYVYMKIKKRVHTPCQERTIFLRDYLEWVNTKICKVNYGVNKAQGKSLF